MAEIKAYLTLIGDDFDPDDIYPLCGISPTYTRGKNDVLKNGRAFGHAEWGIETDLLVSDSLEDVLCELALKITCEPQILREIAEKCAAEWNVLILLRVFNGDIPVLYFPAEFIQLAAQLCAKIGFDTYLAED